MQLTIEIGCLNPPPPPPESGLELVFGLNDTVPFADHAIYRCKDGMRLESDETKTTYELECNEVFGKTFLEPDWPTCVGSKNTFLSK